METIRSLASACRYCRYYKPEGRRGGTCQQLGTPVKGKWAACSLAMPPFPSSWEGLEDVWNISEKTKVFSSDTKQVTLENVKPTSIGNQKQTESAMVKI